MKFASLLKKELKEILTPQILVSMLIMPLLLMMMGTIMGGAMDKIINPDTANIYDMDNTDFTKSILNSVMKDNTKINFINSSSDDFRKVIEENNISSLIVIPKGFTDSLLNTGKAPELKVINVMTSTAISGPASSEGAYQVSDKIQKFVKREIMKNHYSIPRNEIDIIEEPVILKDVTIVTDKSAEVPMGMISSFSMMQNMIIAVLVFVLVAFTSQMMMSSIATEKVDKTFEALLSAPISRMSILSAKMLATTIVALVNIVIYMIGFTGMMSSLGVTTMMNSTGIHPDVQNSAAPMGEIAEALSTLGLQNTVGDYALVGLQMFLTIMITLCIAMILGSMATDAKSVQSLSLPIMLCTMFPYMITMLSDVNTLSPVLKVILYAIPFTHTFTAINNITFGNIGLYLFGLIYQLIFLLVCMLIAVKIFNSDMIFTSTFGIKKKRSKNTPEED